MNIVVLRLIGLRGLLGFFRHPLDLLGRLDGLICWSVWVLSFDSFIIKIDQ